MNPKTQIPVLRDAQSRQARIADPNPRTTDH